MAMLILEISSKDAYNRIYKSIPEGEYYKIIETIQGKDNDEILLPETKWALGLRKRNSPRFMEDLYKLRNNNGDGYLDIFLRAKERRMISGMQTDLNQYKSIAELGRFVSSLNVDAILGRTKGEQSNAIHDSKDNIDKLYEDDTWIVLIPKSHEASCYWAQGAHWCTAYRDSDEYFITHSEEGPLFMNINKKNKEYNVQFHFESEQFMDYWNQDIQKPIFDNIPSGNKLKEFYRSYLTPEKFMEMVAIPVAKNRYIYVSKNEDENNELQYFLTDVNLNIIAGPYCNLSPSYSKKFCQYSNDDGHNGVISIESGEDIFGEPMQNIRISTINQNKDEVVIAATLNSSNMDDDGKITTTLGHTKIYLNGKVYDTPYKEAYFHGKSFFVKTQKGFYNVLNMELEPIFKKNYLNISPLYFNNTNHFVVQSFIDGKTRENLANDKGEFLLDEWVVWVRRTFYDFNVNVLEILTNDGYNFIGADGSKLLPFNFSKNYKARGEYACEVLSNDNKIYYIGKNLDIFDKYGKLVMPSNYKKNGINENRNILSEIKVVDAYQRFYQDIPENDYQTIVQTIQNENDTLLPETKWVLKLYKSKSPRLMEDLYKLHNDKGDGYLDILLRAKERKIVTGNNGDLNRFKSISELGKFVNSLDYERIMGRTKGEMSNAVHNAKDDVEKLYEDDTWLIVSPKTHEASCYWGQGTEWCTAVRDNDEYFNMYTEDGPLYININKKTGEKYQFHFESEQYMDKYDNELGDDSDSESLFDDIPDVTDGFMQFYYNHNPRNYFMLMGFDKNGLKKVSTVKGQNFITTKGEYLSDRFFWRVSHFHNGFAVVECDLGKNYLKPDGELLSDIWFFHANLFDKSGMASVDAIIDGSIRGNIIDSNGEFIFNKWLNGKLYCPTKGCYIITVYTNAKPSLYFIDENGEKLTDAMDRMHHISSYLTIKVSKHGYMNWWDTNTRQFLFDKWFVYDLFTDFSSRADTIQVSDYSNNKYEIKADGTCTPLNGEIKNESHRFSVDDVIYLYENIKNKL